MISKRSRNRILLGFVLLAGIDMAIAWKPVQAAYFSGVPNQLQQPYLFIPTGATYEQVVDSLKKHGFIQREDYFRWMAERMKYSKSKIRPGRYALEPGWTNRDLIKHLRAGKQAPVRVVLTNERLPEDVAAKVARFLEADSAAFMQTFTDPAFLSELGCTSETLMTLFIPNTYELYWNTDPRAFVKRMQKESTDFWNKDDRKAKAQALGLTTEQVYTLASIVERETNQNTEKPTIAGVYLNRLKIGMLLQADPTCVFATRDFTARRVLQYHTRFESPYNTYLHTGLPPGPISMAGISSIDAVLNPEKHDYLYFCARPDASGTHAYAATLQGHNVNVERFREYMRHLE